MKNGVLFYVEHYCRFIGSQIDYSFSGSLFHIDREEFGPYKTMGNKQNLIYNTINDLAAEHDHYACIRLMLQYRIGDCGDQSAYLSALLSNTTYLSKRYRVFYAAYESERVNHGFVLMVPRSNQLLQSDPFQNKTGPMIVDAEVFLDNEAIIVADPWQNKIFPNGINQSNNPFNFTSEVSISAQQWVLQEFKVSNRFQHLQLHCLDSLIEGFDCLDRTVKLEIRDTVNYQKVLIDSAARPDQIELTRILLCNIPFIPLSTTPDDVLKQAKSTAILADNCTGLELINAFIAQKELEKTSKHNKARMGFFDEAIVDENPLCSNTSGETISLIKN
ncbi:hypothetical protein Lbir_2196 [Legionella birminghamensis]|uniref:Uncharacterized protein n=1 Tax=Legionella birminghamensis TaxID=28083 RepID=A0A378JRK6_9GAMM|nr:hypothetical protein [Legionella birminghamensis]KTC69002.1 hypothetical protein Lbir_2196 [Legionella birminghamensis]STX61006.1 Uncharacterised protein [Legionella birminghamensis]